MLPSVRMPVALCEDLSPRGHVEESWLYRRVLEEIPAGPRARDDSHEMWMAEKGVRLKGLIEREGWHGHARRGAS